LNLFLLPPLYERYGVPRRTKDTPAPPGTPMGDSANRVLP
jgi:hypothetical protein